MAKGDKLHQLIHSLELNEKRYFKLQSSLQKKDSNLARLFDYYVDTRAYEEKELRSKFKGEKFLDQLAVTQNHLYELILRTMRLYHLKRSVEFSLQGMLQDVQFLYEKGLFGQSALVLRKVRKAAMKNEVHIVMLNVLHWEALLLSEGFYVGKDENDIDAISDEYYEILGALQNEREYAELQAKIFNNYYKIGVERSNSDYKTNDQIINQFALKDPERALTFRSKCCYLNIHALYNKINGNWEVAYDYRKQLFELVSEQFGSGYNKDISKRYFVALNNLIPIAVKLKKWSEAEDYLNKIEAIEEQSHSSYFSEEMRKRILLQASIGRLAMYSRVGDKQAGLDLVESLAQRKDEFEAYHRKYVVLHLYFNLAYFLFTVGAYSRAVRWLNMVLNDTAIKSAEDLHASTRILTLILQYELGRSELLEYLARSTYRFLSKLDGIYKFEEIMLNFMKKFSKNDALRKDKDLFFKLKEELLEAGYEPGERNALSTIDLVSWVDSKLAGKPLFEVLKEKNVVQG